MTFEENSADILHADTQTALDRAAASTHRHEALFSDLSLIHI